MNKGFNLQLFASSKPEIPKIETKFEILNSTDSEVVELYLYGSIRKASYWWNDDEDDYISSKKVRNALKDIKGKKLKIRLNSGGGDVFESIAIANTLSQYDGEVDVYIDALAASGASIIAAAADKVFMPNNSMQMIHKAWTIAAGNADEFRKQAEDLDKINASVKASYMARFVGNEDELTELLKNETWLTAEECLAFGLCDEIIAEKKEEEQPKENFKETLFNKYKKNIVAQTEVAPKATIFDALKKENSGGMNNE